MNNDKCPWWGWCILIILFLLSLTFAYYRGVKDGYYKRGKEYTTPVEKEVIDTLYITRDNYINSIKYLDSIKYDTIQKVYNLNDSATFLLFLQLVSE